MSGHIGGETEERSCGNLSKTKCGNWVPTSEDLWILEDAGRWRPIPRYSHRVRNDDKSKASIGDDGNRVLAPRNVQSASDIDGDREESESNSENRYGPFRLRSTAELAHQGHDNACGRICCCSDQCLPVEHGDPSSEVAQLSSDVRVCTLRNLQHEESQLDI